MWVPLSAKNKPLQTDIATGHISYVRIRPNCHQIRNKIRNILNYEERDLMKFGPDDRRLDKNTLRLKLAYRCPNQLTVDLCELCRFTFQCVLCFDERVVGVKNCLF